VPHQLASELQATRLAKRRELLPMLANLQKNNFAKLQSEMRAGFLLKWGILHNGLFVAITGQQNQPDNRHSEIHANKYVSDQGLPGRAFDDLAQPIQFTVLCGTYYRAIFLRGLFTWQKSARSSTP
jgi:hypothetical protein